MAMKLGKPALSGEMDGNPGLVGGKADQIMIIICRNNRWSSMYVENGRGAFTVVMYLEKQLLLAEGFSIQPRLDVFGLMVLILIYETKRFI
jgi:hypothetical protein